ncbi:unnamed protein product [Ambrosiozyma monospora]|uniref:Unnamed protein product n=1 Tax=Ambrosiozyma monospora TaxID=43982 RepID=A0A9W6Z617_AMBMO|nr:unnamed protein product [Ambrosiozyma monospora]
MEAISSILLSNSVEQDPNPNLSSALDIDISNDCTSLLCEDESDIFFDCDEEIESVLFSDIVNGSIALNCGCSSAQANEMISKLVQLDGSISAFVSVCGHQEPSSADHTIQNEIEVPACLSADVEEHERGKQRYN